MPCKSVLIVEDDDDIRNSLRELLEFEGLQVCGARNGQEGIEKLGSMTAPCLVLLDLMMPVMTGQEFLAVKDSQVRIAPIPVVIISAVADRSDVPRAHVKEFIRKPIDIDLLLKVVKSYCR